MQSGSPSGRQTFSEPVQAGSGFITLKKLSDNSTVESFDVSNPSEVGFSGSQVTVNLEWVDLGHADDATIQKAIENVFGGMGYEVVSLDAQNRADLQLNQLEDVIALAPDAIIINFCGC